MTAQLKLSPAIGLGLVLLISLSCLSPRAIAMDAAEAKFRAKYFLDDSVTMEFKDEKGAAIDMATFSRETKAGKRFSLSKSKSETGAVAATFELLAPPSADDVAKARLEADRAAQAAQKSKMIGKPLPAFKMRDLDGKVVSNADLRGRPTLINFFFAECLPCILETPMLNAYRQQKTDLRMLAITFDGKPAIDKYVRKHKFTWQSLMDAQPFITQVGVQGFPSFMLLDEKGIVRAMQVYPDFVLIEEKGAIKAVTLQPAAGKESGKFADAQDMKRLDDWVRRALAAKRT